MQRRQATQSGRTWRPSWTSSAGDRRARPGVPFTGARSRPRGRPGRFRGRPAQRRGTASSAGSALTFARGLLPGGKDKAATRSRLSSRTPALLAVLGGLGAAGAAVFKRRRRTDEQSPVPAATPVGQSASTTEEPSPPRPA